MICLKVLPFPRWLSTEAIVRLWSHGWSGKLSREASLFTPRANPARLSKKSNRQMELVRYSLEHNVCTITMNRPDKRNALNPELIAALRDAFKRAETDSEAKVVILAAEGEAFCAGADLAYLQRMQGFSYEENLNDSTQLRDLFWQIYSHPKVIIARIQGPAIRSELIAALRDAFKRAETDSEAKVVILAAEGEAFCAGADLAYLQRMQGFSYEENLNDSTQLRDLFWQIYSHPKVIIARIQGPAI